MKKTLMVILTALMCMTFVFAHGAAEAQAPVQGAGGSVPVLRIGSTTAHDAFSIASSNGIFGRMNYNSLVCSNMLKTDENGSLIPDFLQTWTLSDDGMDLYVTWPSDAMWHDGTPVTKDDVQFSFDTLINIFRRKQYGSFELTGENSGVIHFTSPATLSTLHSLTTTAPVLKKDVFEGQDMDTFESPETVIGCGPYRFVSYDADAQTSYYEKFDGYYGDEATIDRIEIRSFGGQEAMMMALANDEIDAVFDYSNPVDPLLMTLIEGNDAVNPGECVNKSNYFYNFFSTRTPMDDVAFRKAAVYALDYELLGSIVNGDLARTASLGIVSPANRGFNEELPELVQDVQLAKDTLAAAGYRDVDGDGFVETPEGEKIDLRITVQYGKRPEMYSRVAEVMMADWAAVGIKSHFDTDAAGNRDIWMSRVKTPDYDVFVGVCSGTSADFKTSFYYMLDSSTLAAGVHPGEKINEAFTNMSNASTEEEYVKWCREMQRLNCEEYAGAALCWDTAFYPYRTDRIDNWVYYPSWGPINGLTWFSLTSK